MVIITLKEIIGIVVFLFAIIIYIIFDKWNNAQRDNNKD